MGSKTLKALREWQRESEKACIFPVLPPRRNRLPFDWQTDNNRFQVRQARAEGEPGKNGNPKKKTVRTGAKARAAETCGP